YILYSICFLDRYGVGYLYVYYLKIRNSMPLSEEVKAKKLTKKKFTPLWTGPSGSGPQGGLTQGLIGKFMLCKERFRIYTIEGLKAADRFSHRLEYGNMWHTCEENQGAWESALTKYALGLCKKYSLQQDEVDHWYRVCKVQFPIYLDFLNTRKK